MKWKIRQKRVYSMLAVLLAFAVAFSCAQCPTVTLAAPKVKLNKKKATIQVGKTVKLKLKHGKKVKWSSSNKKIAVVSQKGVVKGKKPGNVKITAKSSGKKYVCKVKVQKKKNSDLNDSENPTTSKAPAETAKPTTAPGQGAVPNFGSQATTTSSQNLPSTAAPDTLAVGNLNVTIGQSKEEVEKTVGGKPDRTEGTPLGFESYIYNPSLDYTNYTQIEFDNDKAVCISTISNYFRYEDLVVAGVDTEETLKSKGFSSMAAKYDYEAAYLYETDTEYVTAYVDHLGDGKVYAAKIYSKKTSQSDATKLDNLSKAEYGKYDATVNAAMAKELFDWACVFRKVKGLVPFTACESNAAQLHAEDMAAHSFVGEDSFNGTKRTDRFEAAYPGYIGSAECNAGRSLDAFGFITWLIDDSECGAYDKIIKSKDKTNQDIPVYYLCTGFANNSEASEVSYATLDMFFY